MGTPADSLIPSLSSGAVGSRFVTQDEIESAKARKEEQWKAAYARLGQEPPSQQQEDYHDGRSLAEKLAANRAAKQEEWEERNKLANQFRALEEDEIMFLDSVRERQEAEERERRQKDGEEVRSFKEAVAARERALSNTPALLGTKAATPTQPKPPVTIKKDTKKSLKGVVVKKKAKPSGPTPQGRQPTKELASTRKVSDVHPAPSNADAEEPQSKRRRVESNDITT